MYARKLRLVFTLVVCGVTLTMLLQLRKLPTPGMNMAGLSGRAQFKIYAFGLNYLHVRVKKKTLWYNIPNFVFRVSIVREKSSAFMVQNLYLFAVRYMEPCSAWLLPCSLLERGSEVYI